MITMLPPSQLYLADIQLLSTIYKPEKKRRFCKIVFRLLICNNASEAVLYKKNILLKIKKKPAHCVYILF